MSSQSTLQFKVQLAAIAVQLLLVALVIYYGLAVVDAIRLGQSNLNQASSALVKFCVQCLPLVIFLPGLLKQQTQSAIYLSLVLLVYLMSAIVLALGGASLGIVNLAIIASLQISLLLFLHWKYKHNKIGKVVL